MPVTLDWKEISLRLGMTVIAGLIIGFNRGEHGRPAGMRTTLLVCLAASLSMILANELIHITGRPADSFIQMDPMRLPLGVLSGMGFIGAGTILRKGNMVLGVTTAATLWFVTVMGLCFGGGEIGLGLVALALGFIILWALKYFEKFMPQDMHGTLKLTVLADGPSDESLRQRINESDYTIISWGISMHRQPLRRAINCDLTWRPRGGSSLPPPIVAQLMDDPTIAELGWQPHGESGDSTAAS
jgi:putative Mg2+ transporter-C (MgtC) family protein